MNNFFAWLDAQPELRSRPWLVLGKGPGFVRLAGVDSSGFLTVALNDVVREARADFLHVIDLSVLERLGSPALERFRYLVIPWVPHVDYRIPLLARTFHKAGDATLADLVETQPMLAQLAAENRLLWYDATTSERNGPGGGPRVRVGTFSAAAVINLLARGGVRQVRTLGVDGGRGYAQNYADLASVTLLDAGQESYDLQFRDIALTIFESGIDVAPLDVESPVRVYVGCEPEQWLAARVLEFSIRRHCSMTVEVTPLHLALAERAPAGGLAGRTPFSFQRFAIPALRDYRGRAIYLDSDMQVFGDLRELWLWPFDDRAVLAADSPQASGRPPQFSVMVLDCGRLQWDAAQLHAQVAQGVMSYDEVLYRLGIGADVSACLPARWNSLERYAAGETALLHYTDMTRQPWLSVRNPLARVWCEELLRAIDCGFITVDEVREAVAARHVRPSLLEQVQRRIADPWLLPARVLRADAHRFVPPFILGGARGAALADRGGALASLRYRAAAIGYSLWVESGAQALNRRRREVWRKLRRALR